MVLIFIHYNYCITLLLYPTLSPSGNEQVKSLINNIIIIINKLIAMKVSCHQRQEGLRENLHSCF